MEYKSLSKNIFIKGKSKLEEMEVFIENNRELSIEIFNGEVDKYSISESGGLSLRGLANDKMGYAYTEKIDESSIDMLIDEAYENGKYIDSQDKENIFSGSDKYEKIKIRYNNIKEISTQEKINFLKSLEKEALGLDNRISSVQKVIYKEIEIERKIINTKGVDLSDKLVVGMVYISVIGKEGDDVKTGMAYKLFTDFGQVDYKKLAKESVERAISMLGAESIKSGNYPVIIENHIFASILSAFISVFSAENVQKDLSLLKNKVGERVGSEKLNIIDNPFYKKGFTTRAFDDEGTSTKVTTIIDKGILKTYLHNWKTAKKDGVNSTGHGYRPSYKSPLSIAPTNLYVGKGNKSLEGLIESVEEGLFIVEVAGLHSGLNPISGDFSLSASGYKINNGKITEPINLITISGNLYKLFKDIEEIGDDLRFAMPNIGYIGSPSIKIASLSIAGK